MATNPLDEKTQAFADKFNMLMAKSGLQNRPTTQAQVNQQTANLSKALTAIAQIKNQSKKAGSVNNSGPSVGAPQARLPLKAQFELQALQSTGKQKQGVQTPIQKLIGRGLGESLNEQNNTWAGKEFKKGLDVLSKPLYTVTNALYQGQKAVNEGEPVWSLADDIGYGAWRGLSGKDRKGFGDVVEESTKQFQPGKASPRAVQELMPFGLDKLYGGSALAKASHASDPTARTLASGIKKTVGGIGDIGLDPLTYYSGHGALEATKKFIQGAEPELKEGLKAAQGLDTIHLVAEDSVKKAIKDSGLSEIKTRISNPGALDSYKTAAENVVDTVSKKLDQQALDISGGGLRGKTIAVKSPEQVHLIAQATVDAARDEFLKNTEKKIAPYLEGKITPKTVAKWSKSDPYFKAFKEVIDKNPELTQDAYKAVQEVMQPVLDGIGSKVTQNAKDAYLKVPRIEFAGKQIAEFPRIGKVLDKISTGVRESRLGGFNKAFNYSSNFDGLASTIISENHSFGITKLENEQKILEQFKDLSKEERAAVTDAIQKNYKLAGKSEELRQTIQDLKTKLHDELTGYGLAKPERALPEYTHLHVTPKTGEVSFGKKLGQLEDLRKSQGFLKASDAERLGLRASDDPIINYVAQRLEANAALSKAAFVRDTFTRYGIKGAEGSAIEHASELPKGQWRFLEDEIKKGLRPGETLFLDNDMLDMLKRYSEMMDVGVSDSSRAAVDIFDELTRRFKTLNTVYNPGYHLKNVLSDGFFGAMDGITPKDYTDLLGAYTNRNTAVLNLGGHEVPFNKLWEDFDKVGTSGFVAAETKPGTAVEKLHKFSEFREDIGRFAHFYGAMKEEVPALIKRGFSPEEAYAKAIDASIYRVNKFKFDFNALTRFEKKYVRRGVPFYTYMRKAVPVILQSIWTNPKWLDYVNHETDVLQKRGGFDLFPSWMKEALGGTIVNGSQPWTITDDLLPTNTLRSALNPKEAFAKLHPAVGDILELSTGKDSFTGKKFTGPGWGPLNSDILTGDLRETGQIKNIYHDIKDPGHKKNYAEQLYNFFGLPFHQVTTSMQKQTADGILSKLETKVSEIDKTLQDKGYSVYISGAGNNITYRIRNVGNGKVVATFNDYDSFQKAVDALG